MDTPHLICVIYQPLSFVSTIRSNSACLSSTKQISSLSHQNITCSRRDIAKKKGGVKQRSLNHLVPLSIEMPLIQRTGDTSHNFRTDIRTLLFGDSQKDPARNILLSKAVQTFIKNSRRFTFCFTYTIYFFLSMQTWVKTMPSVKYERQFFFKISLCQVCFY